MFIKYNPNPAHKRTGDCIIRAITKVTGKTWEQVFVELAIQGFTMYAMPSENDVLNEYLYQLGFDRYVIPNTCPRCYTIKDFARDNPYGEFILGTGSHVVAVVDGDYFDSWDSGEEVPLFYWRR